MTFVANKYPLTAYSIPLDICAGPDANVWTCAYDELVSKVTTAGSVTNYTGPSRCEGIIAGPDGLLWITNVLTGGISKMTTGGTVTHYSVGTDSYGVCVGPDGNIWYTYGSSSVATHIDAVTTSGASVASVTPSGATNLVSICAGPDGNLWAADTANKLWRVTPAGVCTSFALASYAPVNSRKSVCVGPDGNLWVAAGGLWQVTTAGVAMYFAPTGVSAKCVCAGPDGYLWVGDSTHHCAWQISTAGASVAQITLTSAAPNSICAGPDGNIWVLDNASDSEAAWQIVLPPPPPPAPSLPVQASMANVTYPSYFVLSPPTTVVSENQLDTGQAPVVGVDLTDIGGSS
jgi:virginiamycin B lyase